jgi:hypothetical protein
MLSFVRSSRWVPLFAATRIGFAALAVAIAAATVAARAGAVERDEADSPICLGATLAFEHYTATAISPLRWDEYGDAVDWSSTGPSLSVSLGCAGYSWLFPKLAIGVARGVSETFEPGELTMQRGFLLVGADIVWGDPLRLIVGPELQVAYAQAELTGHGEAGDREGLGVGAGLSAGLVYDSGDWWELGAMGRGAVIVPFDFVYSVGPTFAWKL